MTTPGQMDLYHETPLLEPVIGARSIKKKHLKLLGYGPTEVQASRKLVEEQMRALQSVARHTSDGRLTLRHLVSVGILPVSFAARVLNDIRYKHWVRRDDCKNHEKCVDHYCKFYGEAADIPAKCPGRCLYYDPIPKHHLQMVASARTESQWSMTAMPEQGWDRGRHDSEDEPEAAE